MNTVLDEILIGELISNHNEEELDVNNASTYLPFMQGIVRLAKQELTRWGNGTRKETESSMIPILKDYYKTGINRIVSESNLRSSSWQSNNPWSAVFISWILRKAGAGSYFKYSAAHWVYVADAKTKRQNNDWNSIYWAYRVAERKPRIGDLVCNSRAGSGINYDNVQRGGSSHCDIVTDLHSDRIVVVGGNVNNSVSSKIIYLNSKGFIDTKRHPNHFAVLSIY